MHTFWRLLGFLRPYRRGVIVSFALAAVAMGTGVLIPFLVGRTVDEIRTGETDLWPLAIAILSSVALVAALTGDGWRDALSWAGLVVPILAVGWAMIARRS